MQPTCPPIDEPLLTHLQEVFPDRIPDSPTSEAMLGVLVGQQKVIRYLVRHFREQTEGSPINSEIED